MSFSLLLSPSLSLGYGLLAMACPELHLLIDSFCHPSWISDSSSPLLGSRHCLFHFSTPIPPRCFLSCPTGQAKHFSLLILFHLLFYYCILFSTCATLYSLHSSAFCFSFSPIPCFLTTSTPHVAQLCLLQKTLPFVFLGLCSLVLTSSAFYKGHYLPSHHLSLHAHSCSSWGQSPHSTVLLHFLPHFLWWCCLLVINCPPEPKIVRLEEWEERELFSDGLDEGL